MTDPRAGAATAPPREARSLPNALANLDDVLARAGGKRLALFLDYDGTLTPIVRRPELATLAAETRRALEQAADRFPVAVISGRDLPDVQAMVGLDTLTYAGCHGFDIAGPPRVGRHQIGQERLPALDAAERDLRNGLQGIAGVWVERKRFSVAVHDREAPDGRLADVAKRVAQVAARHPTLRLLGGKRVHELRPGFDWDKGKALRWVLAAMGLEGPDVLPVYIGDDATDEDAFRNIEAAGLGILVREAPGPTWARYALEAPDEVRQLVAALARST